MLHLPILRKGRPYRSVDLAKAVHYRTKEPMVEISQANSGLIRRDLLDQETPKHILGAFSTTELMAMSKRAADYFFNDTLPFGDGQQSPLDYVLQVSATTGLPHVMVRRNMTKIRGVLAEIDSVLAGLTRNLDLRILDAGHGEFDGHAVSFFPRGSSLGVVLPNNSPGVHSLWAPAIPLKTPLVVKPGRAEPWTPFRMIQSWIKAGVPPEAFCFYPTDHAGAGAVLMNTGRGMLFGDIGAMKAWRSDPRIELHGPGYSKVVLGPDCANDWERYLDVMVASILENSGRSCINASGVWVTANAEKIADGLAARLARVTPRAADDPQAQIAPFADPNVARRISRMIDSGLQESGAREVTASYRQGDRLAEWEGSTYLLPTIVHCPADHGLANREFLFPFASVVEVAPETLPEVLGPSLVVTAITNDPNLRARLLASPHVGRLNFGPVPTLRIGWDQPHEGNLFEHLYARRAFQLAPELVEA